MKQKRKLVRKRPQKGLIVSVVENYVRLRRKGKQFIGECPFHRDPLSSLSISPESDTFRCSGCNSGGTAVYFLMRIENLNFRDAFDRITRVYGPHQRADKWCSSCRCDTVMSGNSMDQKSEMPHDEVRISWGTKGAIRNVTATLLKGKPIRIVTRKSRQSVVTSLLGFFSGIPVTRLRSGNYTPKEWDKCMAAAGLLGECRIRIEEV